MRWSRAVAAAVFAVVLVPSVAGAQSAPPSKQKSEQIYREAVELAKANKFEAALVKFDEARAAAPNARATYQMARMELALNRFDLALFHYRQSLLEEGLPTAERSEAVKQIEDLKTKVGVIMIESPAGVTVTVDGNAVPDPKVPVEVAPGTHVVKATLGGESRVAEAKLEAGKVVSVKLTFNEPTSSNPNGTPTSPNPPPTTITPPHEEQPSYWTAPHIAGVGLAGLAVVGLGLSVFFVVSHESNISDQEDLAPKCVQPDSTSCRSFRDHGDSADTAKTLTIVSAAVTVAAAAGAAILLWPRASSSSTGIRSTRIAPTGTGAVVFGSF